ncbi:hypothetical protein Pelo_18577 [Pelomyxa schiedti]|nr:hypothetical protein Pelo_18577 [Pelomyxa schiedti]
MDSRTSVHVIKTACHVVVAVFVRPAALPDSAQSSGSPIIPLKRTRLQSLASKAEFVYFAEVHIINATQGNGAKGVLRPLPGHFMSPTRRADPAGAWSRRAPAHVPLLASPLGAERATSKVGHRSPG